MSTYETLEALLRWEIGERDCISRAGSRVCEVRLRDVGGRLRALSLAAA